MKKNKDICYKQLSRYITDKDYAVNSYLDNMLCKTQSMFKYDGLPDTIPQSELELILQTKGAVFITDVDGALYAFSGAAGGVTDVYYRPTQFIVSNPALQLNKTYTIGVDGVYMTNDTLSNNMFNIIGKYAVLLTDTTISMQTAAILSRITMLISASDDKTKSSAEMFVKHIYDGDFSVIGENAFFKGVQLQTPPSANNYLTQLIELSQYVKASMYNDLGLNANYNMKRERLNLGEVEMNVDALLPYVEDMLRNRVDGVAAINGMYGTDIHVDLNSSWNLEKEQLEMQTQSVEVMEPYENNPVTGTPDNDVNKDDV